MLSTQLFQSQHLFLAAYDPEKDAAVEAKWTYDLNYAWAMDVDEVARPLTSFELKKKREEQLKKAEEGRSSLFFAIRTCKEDELIGLIAIPWLFWVNRDANLQVLIGDAGMRRKYYTEALNMALRYVFEELGLYHVYAYASDFDDEKTSAYRAAGMQLEVRQRQMVYRGGRTWDRLIYGMLQREWFAIHPEE